MIIAIIGFVLWPLYAQVYASEPDPIAPKDAQFLGLTVAEMNAKTVRRQLWQIGGLKVSRSTRYQHNIDKFFPRSRLEDSYNLTFYYNDLGDVTRFRRLYRPYSSRADNNGQRLSTRTLAMELAAVFGRARIERKGYGGFRPYLSYVWEDDVVKIRVDRLESHSLGDVFVEYRLKQNDPYAVQSVDDNELPKFVKGI